MKKISIVSSCFNEENNVIPLYEKIKEQMEQYSGKYIWELIYIDNCSTDETVENIRKITSKDKRVKAIVNSRNFGWVRSPHHVMVTAQGDAVILMASDFQDPPELLPKFIEKWEEGYKIALGQKTKAEESIVIYLLRELFYRTMRMIADDNTVQLKQCTGFGLYDKCVIDIFRKMDDPYPYLRGLICEIGYEKALVPFTQPKRKSGLTKNKFYSLYDYGMLGMVKHSKIPLRMATFAGFIFSMLSLVVALFYFIYKLIFWTSFDIGMAPMVIGLFGFASFQLFALGILGEYIGAIYTRVDKKPLVVEKERINFDD